VSVAQSPPGGRAAHVSTVLRGEDERVTPLELFFDLVFVLAVTQCTALMAHEVSWKGIAQGLLVLGVLWWAWVGYSWLTSVVDPEEGDVRLTIFAAMAALVVAALCVPHVFGESAALFAVAYGGVRIAQIVLFVLASRDDPGLRHSVLGLAISTAIGVAIIACAALADGGLQIGLWALALAFDAGGPMLIDSSGWRLVPRHFAERHGLIVLIALGESIVAIGVGAEAGVDAGVAAAAVLGTVLAASLFVLYFDVVAMVATRRLENAEAGQERNEIARDSFSYLHFPMVAGIVLVDEHLHEVPAVALLGGVALYLLAHVAFRWRNVHRFSAQRVVAAIVALALIPVARAVPALVTLALLAALMTVLVGYERVRFAELRGRLRRRLAEEG
jgi:low temperature requirement protein LtrA